MTFGPINPADPEPRARWIKAELDLDWHDFLAEGEQPNEEFSAESLSTEYRLVVWTSRRCALEYCGFLDWLWRLGERPCEIVDVTDLELEGYQLEGGRSVAPRLAVSAGLIPFNRVDVASLLGRAAVLPPSARRSYHRMWERVRSENAPLRVIAAGEIASAPLSFFDDALLSHARPEWRKAARVIGDVLDDQWKEKIYQASDFFLWARVRALARAGRLLYQGTLASMTTTEIRLG